MKVYLLSAIFSLGIVSGCKTQVPVEPQEAKTTPVVPLTVGNKWIVRMTDHTSNSAFTDSIVVIKDTSIYNEQWFSMPSFSLFGRDTNYYTNRSDGLYKLINDTARLFLKNPTGAGQSYFLIQTHVKVVSTQDTLVVPAGQFICYHYDLGGFDQYWYAPGVGVIRQEQYNYSGTWNKLSTIDLLAYSIK